MSYVLSPNYTLEEMTFSETALRRGVPNEPGPAQVKNLVRLTTVLLEPLIELLGEKPHTNSGYRSPVLNQMIGGAHDSAHVDGRALDGKPAKLTLQEMFDAIRASDLPYDQVIIECGAWIHVAIAPDGKEPRLMALIGSGTPGNWTYRNA